MGILDAYQDSTDTALRVMATQPLTPEPVTPKHSTWSAPFRAVAAGAAEVAGNVMDTAGAFGQVSAAAGGLTPGFDPDAAKNRNATVEAFDKLKTDGINWRTDEAQQAYKFGSDLRPDPLTAGTAENLMFSLTKGLTKAIGAAVALGPVGGAAAFGASEGMTTAEDLANQGVDQATRTKVGAVTAGFNAAGVLLPVAGKTLAQTAGLVLTGGPLSFMAQQAATREILRNADYKTIAEQYDPLDPVGLTVATLLPAGFAAYAKRGGFAQHAGPTATPEAVDAAMVQNLTVARDDHSSSINRIWLKPIDDSFIDDPFNVDPNSRAYTIGTVQAIDEAINLVGEKRFSELALPRSEKQATDTLYFDQAQRVEMVGRKIVDFYEKNPPPKFDEAPPTAPLPAVKDSFTTETPDIVPTRDDIDAAMVHNLTTLRDVHEATPPEKFAAELWRGQVTENPNFKAWFGDSKVVGEDGSPMVVYHGTGADIQQFNVSERGEFGGGIYLTPDTTGASDYAMYRAQGPANVMPVYVSIRNPAGAAEASQVASWKGEENARAELIRRGYDGVIDMRSGQIVAFRPEQIKSAIGNSGKFDPNSGSLTDRIEPTAPAKPAEDVTPELYRARVEQLATEQPDLVARLDDAGQPVRLADELAAVRKAAQEGTDTEFGALDAPLLKVAAECALATGTAAL